MTAHQKACAVARETTRVETPYGVFSVPRSGRWYIVLTGCWVNGFDERAASTDLTGARELARAFRFSRILDARTGQIVGR